MSDCNDSNTLSYTKEKKLFGMEDINSIAPALSHSLTNNSTNENTQKKIHGLPIEIYCGELYKQISYIRQEKYLLFSKYKNSNKYQCMDLSTIKDRVKLKQLNDYEELYMYALEKVIILMKE